jgi:hypothetical protein
MADLAGVSLVLSSIKAATDIARVLKDTNLSLEKADSKLELAEPVGALADAKIQIAEVQDLLLEKEAKIKKLEERADTKKNVLWEVPWFWHMDGGKKDGLFCQQCYDKDSALIRRQDLENGYWVCNTCQNTYAMKGRAYRSSEVDTNFDEFTS